MAVTEKKTFEVLVVGNYFCDVIFTGLGTFPTLGHEIYSHGLTVIPGGGAYITGVGLHRLGIKVGWAGLLGNDFFSQFIEQQLAKEGFDTALVQRVDRSLQRVTVALSYPADRAFVTYTDTSPSSADFLLYALQHADFRHLHFPGLSLDERLLPLLDVCRQRGTTFSMDCQYREVTIESPLVRETLSRLDYFMPNVSEAKRITGKATLDEAAAILCELVPCLIVKDGAQGVWGWQGDASPIHVLPPTAEVVDTTGAGDSFNAGFLAARQKGKSFETSLHCGNFCGSQSVQGVGGTGNAPYRDQFDQFVMALTKDNA